MTVKKVIRKKENVEKVKSIPKGELPVEPKKPNDVLSHDDLKMIEIQMREVEITKLRCAVEEQSLVNLNKDALILSHKIEKQREVVSAKDREVVLKQKQFNSLLDEIRTKYEINVRNFDINPKTGQIIKGE